MTAKEVERFNWKLVIGFWLVIALLLIGRSLMTADSNPLYGDTDDAMRIVTMTQILDGQNWQDHWVARDNTPFGAEMHWSRLIDAPIAALAWLAEPIAKGGAIDVVGRLWPALLLLPLLILCVALTRRLVPDADQFTALTLPVLSLVILAEFFPGRVDHHNVQMVLTAATVLSVIESRRHAFAASISGLLAATSLAIGLETLPFVVLTIVVYGMFLAENPAQHGRAVRWFALSFCGGTFAHFLFATSPSAYFVPACDMLSLTYVVASSAASAALLIAAGICGRFKTAWVRLLFIAALGAVAGIVTLALFPGCARGPYAQVDPVIYDLLFPSILEAQPLWTRFLGAPSVAIGLCATPLIALVMATWICQRTSGETRKHWLVLLAFLAMAVVSMILQVRGARLAAVLAVPVGAWAITRARQAYLQRRSFASTAMLVGSWLLFASMAQWAFSSYGMAVFEQTFAPTPASAVSTSPTSIQSESQCYLGNNYTELAALQGARSISPLRLAPYILHYTPHSVVSAGFHRNNLGTLDALAFFNGTEKAARAIAEKRGLAYVVICDGLAELDGVFNPVADAFVTRYRQGKLWDWVQPISAPGAALTIYRIQTPSIIGQSQ